VGCFGCWLKTPGACLQKDGGQEIATAVIRSDMVVLFSPVVFGGYSAELKRAIDRFFSPLLQPYMGLFHGETHHFPRYEHYPRLVGIGVQQRDDDEEANIFKLIVGRNALNLHAPSYAVEVVNIAESVEQLRQHFEAVLKRNDVLPIRPAIPSFSLQPDSFPDVSQDRNSRRALLLVGSPKGTRSTSACLGSRVLDGLKVRGWETHTLTLKASLSKEEGRAELLDAVDRTDLLLLSFPLYNDALPVFVLQALSAIAARRKAAQTPAEQRMAVIINNGFPETYHNAAAIAVCRKFAAESGIHWAGSLALGAGEAISGGQPLMERKGLPSVKHVLKALDQAAEALHDGQSVPSKAVEMIAKTPVPLTPFSLWRWIFIKKAGSRWQHEAAENNVRKDQLLARPFLQETESTRG